MRTICGTIVVAAIAMPCIAGAIADDGGVDAGLCKKWPLQERIDAIAADGGGTLVLTAGVYRTGALFFRPAPGLSRFSTTTFRDFPTSRTSSPRKRPPSCASAPSMPSRREDPHVMPLLVHRRSRELASHSPCQN